MHTAKYLLWYVKGSIKLGITYSASMGIEGIRDLMPITF
jgi:hypothetical protein